MAETKEILSLAVEIGETMLKSGAEIYRVEDSVIRILEAYGLKDFDIYVLSNGIFASANENQADSCSMVRHVSLSSIHLNKITALNQLTRDICNHLCTPGEARERLAQCKQLPSYPHAVQLLACGLVCGAFTILFGGTLFDALFSFFIGVAEQLFMFACGKHRISRFLTTIYTSVLLSFLSILIVAVGFPVIQDKIVVGSIMPLVPGIAFTTSIRDFYNGDYLSGTIHLIDALLTALSIAVGVSCPIILFRHLGGAA